MNAQETSTTPTAAVPNERFSYDRVIDRTFTVWARNVVPFLLITTIVYLPIVVWGLVAANADSTSAAKAFVNDASGVATLLGLAASAAVNYGVVKELQGERATIGACLATGLRRFLPVFGVAILMSLAILGGLLLLIIPGLIMATMFYVALPAAVIERPGLLGALKRSRELTAGYRWPIFGLMFLFALMQFVAGFIVAALFMQSATMIYAEIIAWIVLGSLGACMSSITYFLLRNDKEGITASELAQVFE
ncbi:MAG TPA: hypothetical protein VGM88_18905 [Kofleriaceae bacterium]|jgi:hypothetical protein